MGNKRKKSDPEKLLRKIRRLERRIERIKEMDTSDSDSDHEKEHEEQSEPHTPEIQIIDSDSEEKLEIPQQGVEDEIEPGLPAAILDLLGESKEKEERFGPKIREEISKRWGKIVIEGLDKTQRQKLMDAVLLPENFQLLKAPKLNPEISAVLGESTKNRDKRLEKAQNHLGLGIAAITNLLTNVIDEKVTKEDLIKKLSEAGQIFLDLHSRETIARRQLITYSLDKKFFSMVQNVKRDAFLFGENLGEKIKATKTAEKSGLQIKRKFDPPSATSSRTTHPSNTRQGNVPRGPPKQFMQRSRLGGPKNQTQTLNVSRRPQVPADRYSQPSKSANKPPHKT